MIQRLNECKSPEGYAEQYLWTLKEGDNIRDVYEFYRRQEEQQQGLDQEQAELEPDLSEAEESPENRNRYRGSLSECSDPDGWIKANYGESSESEEFGLHPAEGEQADGGDAGAGADDAATAAAAAASSMAPSESPLQSSRNAGVKQSSTPEAGC